MNRKKIAAYITNHEGKRLTAYKDTEGFMTVGIGFNLERQGGRQRIEALNLNYDDVCSGVCPLGDYHVNTLFDFDLDSTIADTEDAVKNFAILPDDVQMAVIDMIFNLGFAGFRKFKKMIDALERYDYCTAAAEMQNSKWARQVPNRAKDNIQLIKQFCKEVRA